MKEKLLNFFSKIKKALSPYKKNIIIPILEILGIIIICVLIVHFMGGHETLSDYAKKNPDVAYKTSTTVSTDVSPAE